MKTKIIKGIIRIKDDYDSGDGIYVGDEVLSDQLSELSGHQVTVRFFISDDEKDIEELKENLILSISGSLHANYGDLYSEYTGYLWTTDELSIGNHNLLMDIECNSGKYAYIEIDIL